MNPPFSGSGGGVSNAELRGDAFATCSNGVCWPGGLGGSTVSCGSCGGGVGRIVMIEERSDCGSGGCGWCWCLVGIERVEYQVARGDRGSGLSRAMKRIGGVSFCGRGGGIVSIVWFPGLSWYGSPSVKGRASASRSRSPLSLLFRSRRAAIGVSG